MVGGGITSPENLIVHGEAFLRNYLIGLEWMTKGMLLIFLGLLIFF